MTYSELKEKAKELGLPYFGIGKTELEESVNTKLAENGEKPVTIETTETLESTKTPEATEIPNALETPKATEIPNEPKVLEDSKETEEPEVIDANVAIVSNNGYEVRRYTQEIHGDKFTELAKQFANHNQYQMKLENIKATEYCRNCGKQLDN